MVRITHLHKPHFARDALIVAESISLAVVIAQYDLVSNFIGMWPIGVAVSSG